MSREVLTGRDYQYLEQEYLIDNLPWQEEIKRRLAEEVKKRAVDPHPTLNTDELEPIFLSEFPDEGAEVEKPVEPTVEEVLIEAKAQAEEILLNAKAQAEEASRSIEQSAKKNAFEIVEKARWEGEDLIAKAKEEAEK
jgi:hypothetical protein